MISKKNSLNLKLELTNNSTSNANMQYLQEGIDRMSHIVEQILLLNRTNPEQYQGQVRSVQTNTCSFTLPKCYRQFISKN
jgi:two-component system sensor histidine kinase QseC